MASRDRFMKNSPLGELPPFGGNVTGPDGYLLGLWVHECQRVFSDKMITLEDKAWVDGTIQELCKSNFAPELTKQVCEIAAACELLIMTSAKCCLHVSTLHASICFGQLLQSHIVSSSLQPRASTSLCQQCMKCHDCAIVQFG